MTQANRDQAPYRWILHPAIDLLFCCGGLVWIFYGIRMFFFDSADSFKNYQGIFVSLIILGHLFSDSHTAATLVRVFRNEENRSRFRFSITWAAAFCLALLVAGLSIEGFPPYLLKAYAILVIHHYTAQTYGIALLYCYKRNYFLSDLEKRIVWLVMNSTAAYAIIREFTFPEWGGRYFFYYDLPFVGPLPMWIFHSCGVLISVSVLAFVVMILRRSLLHREHFPLPSMMLLLTSIAIFVADGQASASLWVVVPAVYHGSQYLVVAASYHLKEVGLPEGVSSDQIFRALTHSVAVRYAGIVVAGGICIYVGLPYILTELGFAYIVAFTCVFTAFNFHHFLTDREIWRLRDPQTRALLLA